MFIIYVIKNTHTLKNSQYYIHITKYSTLYKNALPKSLITLIILILDVNPVIVNIQFNLLGMNI